MNKTKKAIIWLVAISTFFILIFVLQFLPIFVHYRQWLVMPADENAPSEVIWEAEYFSVYSLSHRFHYGIDYMIPITFWLMMSVCLAPIALSIISISLKNKRVVMARNIVSIASLVLLAAFDLWVILVLPNAFKG